MSFWNILSSVRRNSFRIGQRRGFSSIEKRTLRFLYDAENEVPIFYPNRSGGFWFEQDYHAPFRKAYSEICNGEEDIGDLEYTMLDPLVCIAAMESIGYLPTNREIGACTIPRIFREKKCYRVRKWRGETMGKQFWYHDVLLRPRHLQNMILKEEIIKYGSVRRARFLKLKSLALSTVVKHAVEVDLMKQQGCNFVIFLSKQEMGRRSAISRELARAGMHVDELKFKMWRPEDEPLYKNTLCSSQMDERLVMTHCRTSPRSEEEPVEWYEENPPEYLAALQMLEELRTHKFVLELDATKWGRNEKAIPWEERFTSTPGGKLKEVIKLMKIGEHPAELLLPKKKIRGWRSYLPGRMLRRRKSEKPEKPSPSLYDAFLKSSR